MLAANKRAKKQVLVLATFVLVIGANKKALMMILD